MTEWPPWEGDGEDKKQPWNRHLSEDSVNLKVTPRPLRGHGTGQTPGLQLPPAPILISEAAPHLPRKNSLW